MTEITDKKFQHWLSLMDEGLQAFFEQLPRNVRDQLDYSIESVDVLEAWLLKRYPNFEAARQDTEIKLFEGAGRYIGEAFRKVVGGRWTIERRPRHLFQDIPILLDYGGADVPICPQAMAKVSTSRREGTFVSSVFHNMLAEQAAYKRRASRTRESAEQAFQAWLSAMDDVLKAFLRELPEQVSAKLDYSVESLNVLETWLLERYPEGEEADAIARMMKWTSILDPATVPPILDSVGRYVGETFRKNIGGRWWLDIDVDVFGVYGELPLIIEFSPEPAPICPLTIATDAIEARVGNDMSRSFCNIRADIPIVRAHLQKQ